MEKIFQTTDFQMVMREALKNMAEAVHRKPEIALDPFWAGRALAYVDTLARTNVPGYALRPLIAACELFENRLLQVNDWPHEGQPSLRTAVREVIENLKARRQRA